MRRYSEADEQRIHLQKLVRNWTRSGLLGREQGQALEASLQGDLKRTGLMLRLGLAVFTGIVLVAAVGLSFMLTDLRSETAVAVLLAIFGVMSLLAADWVVTAFKAYRHGVEEMLAMAGVGLLAFSPVLLTSSLFSSSTESLGFAVAGAVGCVASLWVYRRFGFLYAPIVAMACAATIPMQLIASRPMERVGAAVVLLAAFVVARSVRVDPLNERLSEERAILQAAALVGVYLVLNVHLTPGGFIAYYSGEPMPPWFRWGTYACTWLLPAAALWLGVRDRERWLIDAGLAMALATLVTNKSYLGWPRQPWDPMLLGLFLAAVALGGRRWLASGPGGERAGFSPMRILESDLLAIRVAGLASAVIQPASAVPPAAQPESFGGGRSGGAGAGGSF
ncbi:MAG: hypothetical protein ABL982_14890 [Vicinamibacterales bacterium]